MRTSNIMGDYSSFVINFLLPKIVNKCSTIGRGCNATRSGSREKSYFSSPCVTYTRKSMLRGEVVTADHKSLGFRSLWQMHVIYVTNSEFLFQNAFFFPLKTARRGKCFLKGPRPASDTSLG